MSTNQTTVKAGSLMDIGENERDAALKAENALFAAYQEEPTEANRQAWIEADAHYKEVCRLYVEGRRIKRDVTLTKQGAYR